MRHTVHLLFPVMIVFGLICPFLSHHGAEMNPFHEHLLFEAFLPQHIHLYMDPTHHRTAGAQTGGGVFRDAPRAFGLVALYPIDGAADLVTGAVMSYVFLDTAALLLAAASFISHPILHTLPVYKTFLPPLKRPPRHQVLL